MSMCALAVEENLAVDSLATLTQWQLFDELFPLSVSAGSNPTPTESLLYRYIPTYQPPLPTEPLILVYTCIINLNP